MTGASGTSVASPRFRGGTRPTPKTPLNGGSLLSRTSLAFRRIDRRSRVPEHPALARCPRFGHLPNARREDSLLRGRRDRDPCCLAAGRVAAPILRSGAARDVGTLVVRRVTSSFYRSGQCWWTGGLSAAIRERRCMGIRVQYTRSYAERLRAASLCGPSANPARCRCQDGAFRAEQLYSPRRKTAAPSGEAPERQVSTGRAAGMQVPRALAGRCDKDIGSMATGHGRAEPDSLARSLCAAGRLRGTDRSGVTEVNESKRQA